MYSLAESHQKVIKKRLHSGFIFILPLPNIILSATARNHGFYTVPAVQYINNKTPEDLFPQEFISQHT